MVSVCDCVHDYETNSLSVWCVSIFVRVCVWVFLHVCVCVCLHRSACLWGHHTLLSPISIYLHMGVWWCFELQLLLVVIYTCLPAAALHTRSPSIACNLPQNKDGHHAASLGKNKQDLGINTVLFSIVWCLSLFLSLSFSVLMCGKCFFCEWLCVWVCTTQKSDSMVCKMCFQGFYIAVLSSQGHTRYIWEREREREGISCGRGSICVLLAWRIRAFPGVQPRGLGRLCVCVCVCVCARVLQANRPPWGSFLLMRARQTA